MNYEKFDFNDALAMIINKAPNKNRSFSRFNSTKLSFIIEAIEEKQQNHNSDDEEHKGSQFPAVMFLDFIEKMIIYVRKGVISKSLKEKVEKAFMIAYKKTSYNEIKEQLNSLDTHFLYSLAKHIPEIDVSQFPKEITDDKIREEETNKRLAELRKERLK